MGRSQETFGKKEKEKKRQKKKEEKAKRREERKANSEGGGLENMLAYVDEFGNITDTPPDPATKTKVKAEDIQLGIPKKEDLGEEDLVHEGKVTFFNDSKGYGFIKSMKDQESYFVHVNGLSEEVGEGDRVLFELEKGMKGLNAVRVKKK